MSGPIEHPAWCERQHNPAYPAHTRDVGIEDVEVGAVGLSVQLYQYGGDPTQVWLAEHRRTDTAILQLTPDQARTLGERLLSAAGAVEPRELRTACSDFGSEYRAELGEGNSGPGGAL